MLLAGVWGVFTDTGVSNLDLPNTHLRSKCFFIEEVDTMQRTSIAEKKNLFL
jgi:hypothetical protein